MSGEIPFFKTWQCKKTKMAIKQEKLKGQGFHESVCKLYDADSRRRVHKLIHTVMDDCAGNVWTEYWTCRALIDQTAAMRNTSNDALTKINIGIKDAVDPAGIMEPGRNGVWPTRNDKSV